MRAEAAGFAGMGDDGAMTGRRVVAALLVLAAVVWLFVNRPVEGPTLLVLSRNHGVTAADLLSVLLVLVAVALVVPRRPRGRR